MVRKKLVTQEEMESYYSSDRRKLLPWSILLKCDSQLNWLRQSFHNDLDLFFENIRLDKMLIAINPYFNNQSPLSHSYFLPKLTEEEKTLVEKQDSDFLKTFYSLNPDVPNHKMKRSESNSKFVICDCYRSSTIRKTL